MRKPQWYSVLIRITLGLFYLNIQETRFVHHQDELSQKFVENLLWLQPVSLGILLNHRALCFRKSQTCSTGSHWRSRWCMIKTTVRWRGALSSWRIQLATTPEVAVALTRHTCDPNDEVGLANKTPAQKWTKDGWAGLACHTRMWTPYRQSLAFVHLPWMEFSPSLIRMLFSNDISQKMWTTLGYSKSFWPIFFVVWSWFRHSADGSVCMLSRVLVICCSDRNNVLLGLSTFITFWTKASWLLIIQIFKYQKNESSRLPAISSSEHYCGSVWFVSIGLARGNWPKRNFVAKFWELEFHITYSCLITKLLRKAL